MFQGCSYFEVSEVYFVLTSFGLLIGLFLSSLSEKNSPCYFILFVLRNSSIIPDLFCLWVNLFQELSTRTSLKFLNFLNLFSLFFFCDSCSEVDECLPNFLFFLFISKNKLYWWMIQEDWLFTQNYYKF